MYQDGGGEMPTVIGGTMKEAISDACWYLRGWGSRVSERMDFANDLWFQVMFYGAYTNET
jgi:hypothetical protein